ncbi:MAG: Spy/CpxP family protein refolding chaperone [Bacteroidota bacterium]
MKKYLVVMLVVALTGIIKAQEPSHEQPMKRPMEHMGKTNFLAKLKLTDEQKKQMKDLKYETDKKAIELRSKLALSKLELGRLLSSDAPDKDAIEKQINEVAANETALHVNKLDGWFEANKILTPEQQKEWREVLRAEAREHMGEDHSEGMSHHHEHP